MTMPYQEPLVPRAPTVPDEELAAAARQVASAMDD